MGRRSHDFDQLAERADNCGALWALRTLYRTLSKGETVHAAWPGTMDQARRLVSGFADRAETTDRETLAAILLDTAALMWAVSLDRLGPT
jgi:hypothetical protein